MGANTAGGIQTLILLRVLKNYVSPFPSLAEQLLIMAKVDQSMA